MTVPTPRIKLNVGEYLDKRTDEEKFPNRYAYFGYVYGDRDRYGRGVQEIKPNDSEPISNRPNQPKGLTDGIAEARISL